MWNTFACVPLLLDKSNIRGLATTDNNYNCITYSTLAVHVKTPSISQVSKEDGCIITSPSDIKTYMCYAIKSCEIHGDGLGSVGNLLGNCVFN
jgi:hypothetical protein